MSLINFLPDRSIRRDTIMNFSRCTFMEFALTMAFCGATNFGKSYTACAIGKATCQQGFKVKYIRMTGMSSKLAEYERQDTKMRYTKRLSNFDLLIGDFCESEGWFC
jgi:DNA replication protein DnaC